MKRRITLYIDGRSADLSEDDLVLMNYTFEDLSNPTIVKNSYSQSIVLEGTPTNNALFGEVWRSDRQTMGGDSHTGVSFDATKKTPFSIYDDMDTILASGYCKLDKVENKGGSIRYTIRLFGGLGAFIYNLAYNADGSKRTLADMTYADYEGNPKNGRFMFVGTTARTVAKAWSYLRDPDNYIAERVDEECPNVINFAPCYNGFPADFDANKGILGSAPNIPSTYIKDGVTYSSKEGLRDGSLLVTFPQKHTEWEICDLRWYLQRPVINVQSILNAIFNPDNNGGYEVVQHFPPIHEMWMTLPMIPTKDRYNERWLPKMLSATMSPADFLLSLCKTYGLVITISTEEKKVIIMPRAKFFAKESKSIIDLTDRIDVSEVSIVPNVTDHKYYQMGGAKPLAGEWAKAYADAYGRQYGIQRINTGYEFDNETTIITKDIAFAEAADVQEISGSYIFNTEDYQPSPLVLDLPTVQYWNGFDSISVSADPKAGWKHWIKDNEAHEYYDWLPKVQLHGEDNKAGKGENVLLFFNGFKDTPADKVTHVRKNYFITDDTPDMMSLNNGIPCWKLGSGRIITQSLPSFRRSLTAPDATSAPTFEWGEPFARGFFQDTPLQYISIYSLYWQRYLTDRYDADTKVMRCKADLSGIEVNQSLLGRFFWYDNAYWVLNKVKNYSLTTEDLTECEFIKVKDIQNYIA